VTPSALVLLHSPLTTAAAWGGLGHLLNGPGLPALVVDVTTDTAPPYASRFVAAAAAQVRAGPFEPGQPVVLVAHGGAGPLLGQVGFALRAGRRPVAGYVFVDAEPPRPSARTTRLDLAAAQSTDLDGRLRAALAAGGRWPDCGWDDLAGDLADPHQRTMVLSCLRPRGPDFFDEPLPAPQDWPDAPCGVLQTSARYARVARLAMARGWPTVRTSGGHFAAVADPAGTCAALLELLELM